MSESLENIFPHSAPDEAAEQARYASLIMSLRLVINQAGLEGGCVDDVLNIWKYKVVNANLASEEWLANPGVTLIGDPSRKVLISYVQPDRGGSVYSAQFVRESVQKILSCVQELGDYSGSMVNCERDSASVSLWVDKVAAYSLAGNVQERWAPLCQMQYFIFPVLVLPPTIQEAYETVDRADPDAKTAEHQLYLLAEKMELCEHCRVGSHGAPQVLCSLWARTWPGAEALAAAGGGNLFAVESDVLSMLQTRRTISRLRSVCLLRELGEVPSNMRFIDEAPCDDCANVVNSDQIWSEWYARLSSGIEILSQVLMRVKITGPAAHLTVQTLNDLQQEFNWNFREQIYNQMCYVRDHLTILGGSHAPCYDPGDKFSTVAILDLIMDDLAHGRTPALDKYFITSNVVDLLIVDRETRSASEFVRGQMLCGLTINTGTKSMTVMWRRNRGSSAGFSFVAPGYGLLSSNGIESLLMKVHGWTIHDVASFLAGLQLDYCERAQQMGSVEVPQSSEDRTCPHVSSVPVAGVYSTPLETTHFQSSTEGIVPGGCGQVVAFSKNGRGGKVAGFAVWSTSDSYLKPCEWCGVRCAVVIMDGNGFDFVRSGTPLFFRMDCWNPNNRGLRQDLKWPLY